MNNWYTRRFFATRADMQHPKTPARVFHDGITFLFILVVKDWFISKFHVFEDV